jgi:hypothetical protein
VSRAKKKVGKKDKKNTLVGDAEVLSPFSSQDSDAVILVIVGGAAAADLVLMILVVIAMVMVGDGWWWPYSSRVMDLCGDALVVCVRVVISK